MPETNDMPPTVGGQDLLDALQNENVRLIGENEALRAQVNGLLDSYADPHREAFGVASRDVRIAGITAEIVAAAPAEPAPAGGRSIPDADLAHWFRYHAPKDGQLEKYAVLRAAGHHFAKVIRDLAPASADTTAAIRKVREAVMTANAAIACDGR